MTDRLDQIITRTGDDGSSSLADGTRLPKSHPRFTAMGDVDELNAHIGVLRQCLNLKNPTQSNADEILSVMQHHLFEIGSELAVPGMSFLREDTLQIIEQWALKANQTLPPLKEFILPAGCQAATQAHVCRSIARRAERSLVTLDQLEPVSALSRQYLNRCSDLFFIMARQLNQDANMKEAFWRGNS